MDKELDAMMEAHRETVQGLAACVQKMQSPDNTLCSFGNLIDATLAEEKARRSLFRYVPATLSAKRKHLIYKIGFLIVTHSWLYENIPLVG
ncbi:hypothetical protein [Allorhizobium ampelinum]|uniref:hypothetical protein n=1 Tax=Allorhizobium ampelinum TaxID=3025782 RepID=UPI0005A0EF99|nr:hypothetical protein [Allorhizobium ampelinum]